MTITITRLDEFHRGSANAQTHAFTGVSLVAGRRYLVIAHALRNGSGGWTPSLDAEVSDDATEDSGWAYLAASADPSYTDQTNGSAMVAFISDAIDSNDTVTITVDLAATGSVASTSTSFLYAMAVYEVSTDTANPIAVVQTAGVAQATDTISIDWTTAPSADLLVAWGAIHNSTASPDTEPSGLTADWTDTAAVPSVEIQTGTSTADPLSFQITVSGTDFDWHGLGIELTDAGSGETIDVADTSGLTDTASLAATRPVDVADTSGLSDAASLTAARALAAAEALGLSDAAALAATRQLGPADSVGLSDALTLAVGETIDVGDIAGISDTATLVAARALGLSDTAGLSDSLVLTGVADSPVAAGVEPEVYLSWLPNRVVRSWLPNRVVE